MNVLCIYIYIFMNSKMISEFVNILLHKKKCSLSSLKTKNAAENLFFIIFFLYMLVNLFCLKPLTAPSQPYQNLHIIR